MSILPAILRIAHRTAAQRNGGMVEIAWQGQNCQLDAIFGRALEAADDTDMQGTVRIDYTAHDFVVRAADLVFGGQRTLPQDGMQITVLERCPDLGSVYEAMAVPGGQCFRNCDPGGFWLRIHCKKVKDAQN